MSFNQYQSLTSSASVADKPLRLSVAAAVMVVACLLNACGGSEPPKLDAAPVPAATSGVPSPGTNPPPGDTSRGVAGSPSLVPSQETIVGFRRATVVLYRAANGNDGERTAVSTMPLPLTGRAIASNPPRLEVVTVDGPRWIDRSEVILSTSDAAAVSGKSR